MLSLIVWIFYPNERHHVSDRNLYGCSYIRESRSMGHYCINVPFQLVLVMKLLIAKAPSCIAPFHINNKRIAHIVFVVASSGVASCLMQSNEFTFPSQPVIYSSALFMAKKYYSIWRQKICCHRWRAKHEWALLGLNAIISFLSAPLIQKTPPRRNVKRILLLSMEKWKQFFMQRNVSGRIKSWKRKEISKNCVFFPLLHEWFFLADSSRGESLCDASICRVIS